MGRITVRKIVSIVTSLAVMAVMIPSFVFAGTYAEKAADGEYHYTAFGDSVTAGRGPAEQADAAFLRLGVGAGEAYFTFNKSPERGYVNLLADMLDNHINSKYEGTSNFIRNENGEWVNRDREDCFTFSNAGTTATGTEMFLDLLNYDLESDKPEGTDEYYEDLFTKNFCNEKGECVSKTPMVIAALKKVFVNDDGTLNKVTLGTLFGKNAKIYRKEIKKADIITIGLGANDMLVNTSYLLKELFKGDESGAFDAVNNAIVGKGIDFSNVDLSKMSDETMIRFIEFAEPAAIIERADKQVDEGLEWYRKILDQIKTEKGDNDAIALIGLFKSQGEAFEAGGKKNVLPVVAGDILDSLVEITESKEYKALAGKDKTASGVLSSALEDAVYRWITKKIYAETGIKFSDLKMDKEYLEKIIKEFRGGSSEYRALFKKMLENRVSYREALRSVKCANEAQKTMITDMLVEKIKMPLMYTVMGAATNAAIEKYNKGIEKLASEYGYKYVDVSDLAPDNDPDPHPDLAGHELIAKRTFEALKDVVPPVIGASDIKTLKATAGKRFIKVKYSAKNKGDVTGYNVQYKVKGSDKWKKVKDTEKTLLKIKDLKKGKKYAVRVRAYNTNSFETVYGSWKSVTSKKVK